MKYFGQGMKIILLYFSTFGLRNKLLCVTCCNMVTLRMFCWQTKIPGICILNGLLNTKFSFCFLNLADLFLLYSYSLQDEDFYFECICPPLFQSFWLILYQFIYLNIFLSSGFISLSINFWCVLMIVSRLIVLNLLHSTV